MAGLVVAVKQRYLDVIGACIYTSKTPDVLRHAIKKGFLKWTVAKDGSKSFLIDDLDKYMGLDKKDQAS